MLAAEEGSPAADVLDEAGGGWLVPPADPGAMSEAIATALSDPDELARRGASAREWAVRHAGQQRMAGEWAVALTAVTQLPEAES